MTTNTLLTVRRCFTCIAVLLVMAGVLVAQVVGAAPSIVVDSFIYDVGDTVKLHADGVQRNSVYTITLTPEDGEAEVHRVQSDTTGSFDFEFVPETAGDWLVEMFGTNLTTTVRITAIALPPAVTEDPLTATLNGRTVLIDDPFGSAFTYTFPAGAGPITEPTVAEQTVYIGVGNHVLAVRGSEITARHRLPATVTSINVSEDGEVSATVTFSNGESETIAQDEFAALHAFDPAPELYQYLMNEAQVLDVHGATEIDPTNPFLWLYAAQDTRDPQRKEVLYHEAIRVASTFYELGQLARRLYADGEPGLATQAMNRAIRDFEQREYSAALLTNTALTELYGFPQAALRQAMAMHDLDAAKFWAPFVQQLTTPDATEHRALLTRYANALQASGDTKRANDIRAFMGTETRFNIGVFFAELVRSLAQNAWLAVVSMLIAALVLSLVLSAKYAAMRHFLAEGEKRGRYFFLRYASFFEKLVLVVLLALAACFTALAKWEQRSETVDQIASGSLANPVAASVLPAGTDVTTIHNTFELQNAVNGSWGSAVLGAFTDPVDTLLTPTFGVPTWAWYIAVGLYALLTLFAVVFLLIPRPRVAKNVPRNWLYVLLAVVFPGTSFADEFWGLVLLGSWAVIALDRVVGLLGGAAFIPEYWAYALLGIIYALNVLALIPEVFSHRRRMKELAARDPELARRLGMRVRY